MRGYDELFYLLPQRRELSFAQLRSVISTMKKLVGTVLATSILVAVALATDTSFKTRLITSATLTIHVRDGVFLTIRNFTQDIDTGQRGVIVAGIFPPTPTPTPTATPTTPTPTPTSTVTPAPTPTPTPIFGTVLTASISGTSSASSAEFVNEVVIAGPAVLTIDPVPGATLSVTYRKSLQPSQPTPTPTATPAPTPTPTPTATATSSSSTSTSTSSASTTSTSSVGIAITSQSIVATAS